jgi:hypothetical protein
MVGLYRIFHGRGSKRYCFLARLDSSHSHRANDGQPLEAAEVPTDPACSKRSVLKRHERNRSNDEVGSNGNYILHLQSGHRIHQYCRILQNSQSISIVSEAPFKPIKLPTLKVSMYIR